MNIGVKFLFDGRKIDDYGIGTYIKNIFGGLMSSERFDYKFLHLKNSSYPEVSKEKIIEIKSKNYSFFEHFETPFRIRGKKDFIYFSPHYVFPLFIKNRVIATIHDLIHFKFPEFFPFYKREVGKLFLKNLQKRGELIFTVSETSKKDIINMFGFDEDRIKVIYNGISEIFFSTEKQSSLMDSPYILYMGNLKPHKNLSLLLKAFSNIKEKYKEVKLILIGIKKPEQIKNKIIDLGIENRLIIKKYIEQKEIIKYIDNCMFFVFPSLYEGFGLPPVEVMARGKAVVSSSGGSLKEILKDNAVLFNPLSEDELTMILEDMIIDESLRKGYEEKSLKYSENFHWDKIVKQYIDILERL